MIGLATTLCGCVSAIHEYPEPYDLSLRITEIYLENHMEPYIIPGLELSRGGDECKMRFTVNLYQDGKMLDSRQLIVDPRQDRTYLTNILFEHLQRKEYSVAVWCEYVDANGKSLSFEYEQITYITQYKPYRGTTDDKDAFSVSKVEDLREAEGEVQDKLTLTRPFGKFRIVANDVEKFMEDRGYTKEQIDKMTVRLVYTSFFPCAYNALTNKPNDAGTGYEYTGGVSWVYEEDVKGLMLTFDFVWVNGIESAVTAMLVIYDENGKEVASSSGINIPYKRGYLTTIIGAYFSNSGGSGIGINTDFDGIIDIYM